MQGRRIAVGVVGIVFTVLFASVILTVVEFFMENDVSHWDLSLVFYLGLIGVGMLLAIASLAMNKFFSRHLIMSGLIVMLFLGVKILPVHLYNYRKIFYPISYAELNKISQLKLAKGDEYTVYVYRTGNGAKTKLKFLDRWHEGTMNEVNLTLLKKEVTPKAYSSVVKRLGVSRVPALIYSYRGTAQKDRPFSVTFNGIDNRKMFAKLTIYLDGDKEKITGPGIVYKQQ